MTSTTLCSNMHHRLRPFGGGRGALRLRLVQRARPAVRSLLQVHRDRLYETACNCLLSPVQCAHRSTGVRTEVIRP